MLKRLTRIATRWLGLPLRAVAGVEEVTRDADQADHLKRLRHHGAVGRDQHPELGGNFRMDELQAALLRVKLPRLRRWSEAARRRLTEALAPVPGRTEHV